MKTKYLMIALSAMILIQLSACGETYEEVGINNTETLTINDTESLNAEALIQYVQQLPLEALNEKEIEGLKFMREEEKLARDVYLTLYDKWKLRPFENISKSEQVHMDAVLSLLEKYGLDDPAQGNEIGVFVNEELQTLYEDLIEQGSKSVIDALKVGALIEEVDILDLQKLIDEDVDNEDIEFVLSNLKRASGFHLKAFVGNLKRKNVEYAPQLLDEDTFNDIIN